MSTWINPYTQIERNAEKRAADITKYKASIKKARDVPAVPYTQTQSERQKAREDYEIIFSTMSYWIARTDFIGAAVAASKTDAEIQAMLVPANDCREEYQSVAVFKALVVALGGTMTDVNS